MRTLRVSVRRLVEFLLRSGDIGFSSSRRDNVEAMQAGSHIHRTLQAQGGDAYQAEVPLACSIFFPGGSFSPHATRLNIAEEAVRTQEGFFLTIEGRADGIIDDGTHPLVFDEIKGVTRNVETIDGPDPMHLAQALCYAYLYLRKAQGPSALSTSFDRRVIVRITYASMTTGEVRQTERTYVEPDVEAWFFSLLEKAQRWAAWRAGHDDVRTNSLSSLAFPFCPRDGQRQLINAVESTIQKNGRLYVQAPTGSGKTIATLYPALKAMGLGKASRIFFLTAKTMTRRPVIECLNLLKGQGVAANLLIVTARDKICPLRKNARGADVRTRPLISLCNPIECPLARRHYDSVNDALYETLTTHQIIDSDVLEDVAARHHVCPYELQRDIVRWADVIVCDYHFAFAPSANLLGLANEPNGDGTIFLVDEAHNLAERMRDMYSAELASADLNVLERLLRKRSALTKLAAIVRRTVLAFPKWHMATGAPREHDLRSKRRQPSYSIVRVSDEFADSLAAMMEGINTTLDLLFPTAEADQTSTLGEGSTELFLALQDTSLRVRAFLGALQRGKVGYVTFLRRIEKGDKSLKIYCVDPSHDLDERLEQAKAAIFFSETLLPMDYHRKLLAARDDDQSVDVRSSFDRCLQQVLIASDISARYSKRGPELNSRIAAYIMMLTRGRPGNYLVFVPSFAMLREVKAALSPLLDRHIVVIEQHPGMREVDRESFVARFREERTTGASLVGLCVLGGIFGESIDLPGEMLVGVVVVGTGISAASAEREVVRDYFDAEKHKGYAYAYTYPGMNKVLQAAGRLIRTEEDTGTVLLLDDRFLEPELRRVFPKEWKDVRSCTLLTLNDLLRRH